MINKIEVLSNIASNKDPIFVYNKDKVKIPPKLHHTNDTYGVSLSNTTRGYEINFGFFTAKYGKFNLLVPRFWNVMDGNVFDFCSFNGMFSLDRYINVIYFGIDVTKRDLMSNPISVTDTQYISLFIKRFNLY